MPAWVRNPATRSKSVSSTTGAYEFEDVPPGDYTLTVTDNAGRALDDAAYLRKLVYEPPLRKLPAPLSGIVAARPFDVEDLVNLARVSDPQVAPDGRAALDRAIAGKRKVVRQ